VRGKIKKTALILPLIASILAMSFAISSALSQGTNLAAPFVIDPTKGPSSAFTIDITVHDVVGMLGYGITLRYDESILTATGVHTYPPFTQAWPSESGDGFVERTYTWPIPEWSGLDVYSEDPPFAVMSIDFTVDNWGVSELQIQNSKIPDCYGGLIDHTAISGVFSNIWPAETMPSDVYMGLTAGFVENRHFKVSKEPDVMQTLTAQLENKGIVTTKARAKFLVLDSMGGPIAQLTSATVYITPGATLRLSADLDTSEMELPASYTVEVQAEYVGFAGWTLGRHGGATAAKTTVALTFKLDY